MKKHAIFWFATIAIGGLVLGLVALTTGIPLLTLVQVVGGPVIFPAVGKGVLVALGLLVVMLASFPGLVIVGGLAAAFVAGLDEALFPEERIYPFPWSLGWGFRVD